MGIDPLTHKPLVLTNATNQTQNQPIEEQELHQPIEKEQQNQ
jgi:hypothetical protein